MKVRIPISRILKWFVKTVVPFLGVQAIDELIKLLEKQKEKLEKK